MILKIFRYLHGALAVPGYADVQALETQVKIECVLRALDRAEIPHQLARGLGDESQFPESFSIYQAVVGRVRRTESGVLVSMGFPIKITTVHQGSSHGDTMAVHVFCGRVGNDVGAKFKRPAKHRGGKSIVDDERHTM